MGYQFPVTCITSKITLFCLDLNPQFGREKTDKYNQLQLGDGNSSDSDSDGEKESSQFDSSNSSGVHLDGKASLIARQTKTHTTKIPNVRSLATMEHEFQLDDVMYFCKSGVEVGYYDPI